jgi:hypothetical protein
MEDSTENVARTYGAIALATLSGDWNLLIEPLMWTRCVEELHIFTHDSSKMGLIDGQQLVQAFFPYWV